MTNNDLVNWGENWYEFKYFSYHDGCNCSYKMPEAEYQEFEEKFNQNVEQMHRLGFKTVPDYIIACLAFNA